ncbi:MAG TPA: hypothetical protein VFM69_12525 [Pricia sp.]|nr:hypothetical protein [Pricia sp.]
MADIKPIDQGRKSFRQRAWNDAFHQLSDADREARLNPKDLELLAVAAYLIGYISESNALWTRAHNEYLNNSNIERAVHCAFQMGFGLFHMGEIARATGWFARARTLLDEGLSNCVEEGYLLLPVALQSLSEDDAKKSLATFEQAGQIGDRFGDRDLMALTRLGRGQALVRLGETRAGTVLLDEAMAAVDSGEISPIFEGIIYCAAIETCHGIFDLGRAHQWTEAMSDWCDAHPQLVPFRGECLTRRSQIMQMHGQWSKAIEEAFRGTEFLAKSISEPATGEAFNQLGELFRLRGEFAQAEEAYRKAVRWGRIRNPGLALLRFAQGRINTAKKSIETAMMEATSLKARPRVLTAYIKIMLAANDLEAARQAADELTDIANRLNATLINAWAAKGVGAVLLYEGDTANGLIQMRRAWTIFEKLDAPYENALVRVLIGKAYHQLGDRTRR